MILKFFSEMISKTLMACVLPGVLLVLANFLLLVRAFRTLDFPQFDLPQNAISEPSSFGKSALVG